MKFLAISLVFSTRAPAAALADTILQSATGAGILARDCSVAPGMHAKRGK